MKETNISYIFIVMASVVIVLAGVKSASTIIIPFLLSLFIAIILTPAYNFFRKKSLPDGLALLVVVGFFLLFIGLMAKLIGTSVAEFSAHIDLYTQKLDSLYASLLHYTDSLGIELTLNELTNLFNTKKMMTFGTSILQGMGSIFTNGFVIVLTVIFMLLESGHFIDKIDFADGHKDTVTHLNTIVQKIQRYMVLKTLMSFCTGLVVWIGLWIIGTDYAFLWGVLAFMFNFIPNIGSIIAAIPAILITLVQLGSVSAFFVSLLYIGVNVIIGSIIEPKVMGKDLGLSTLIVFLSLLFWGWLLGIVGMLLSIPLTIMAKIVFDADKNTKWISVLLGTGEDINKKKI